MVKEIKIIDYKTAIDFLLPRHYSGRKPTITVAYGWYIDGDLKAVVSFGKPASNPLCIGVCGEEHSAKVYELNRLCRTDDLTEPLSEFVSYCLRTLKNKNWIIVSYADAGMHHNGYIYQALNFLYTGSSKGRTDKYTEGNKHARHYDNNKQNGLRKVRTSKHRYIYFATPKKLKKYLISILKYPILPYPKNENKNYTLGEFQKPIVIKDETNKK